MDGESYFEPLERYNELMRVCPHHGLEKWLIIHTFYNGSIYNTRMTIDGASGRVLINKPFNDLYGLIENMTQKHY